MQRLLGKPSRSPGTHPMEICLKIEAANGSSDGLNFNPMKEYMILSGPQKIAIAVLCTLLGLLSALENLVVLYLIGSSHRLRKKPSYLFIGSLAGADFLASVVFASSFVHFHVFDGVDSKAVFLLKIGSVTLTFTASLGSLLLTAIDRYLCLRYPPTYKALLTRRRIAALFAGIIYTYAHVLWKAHQHVASLAEHRDRHLSGIARMRLDVRLAKTLGMLLAVLFIFWFPVLALMVYSLGARLSDQVKKVFAFCSLLCLVNSMVNPIIYALRSGEIRSSAHHCLARWKKCVRGLGPEGKGEIPRSSVTETEADVKTTPGLDSRELSWPDEL
ncbi:PREDICTED: cannabinoid receptor 2 [Bison bison bison]|uniref:Cannabinoid receptor 2 n=1 Tax=Bison bison bison TaxID=43346 RepID=A0A6P3GG65_BISBB|nr:PREDICTED: cannabinoid receptor 2 [Bison bison bison]